MSDPNSSSIERLKKNLYSRNQDRLGAFGRRRLREEEQEEVKGEWTPPPPPKSHKKRPLITSLLFVAVLFFVLSLALASFLFFRGSTTVSARNIDIEIQGPVTIGGGDELTLQIAITNRNATPIEVGSLLVEYPEGTRSSTDVTVELPRVRESVGDIRPGERVEKTVRAILFGEEGSDVSVKTTFEYRVPGSNAIFYKEQVYDLLLSTAPLAIIIDAVREITSGQETEFEITVLSNSDTVINDVLLSVDYPFGFQFAESKPQPAFTNNVWEIGDIEPEGKRTITLKGTVTGENEEERVFRFSAGIRSKVNETVIETAFATKLHAVTIEKPFIGVELALDGDSSSLYVTETGSRVRGDIRWFNNLPVQIFDAEIEVRIIGSMLNESTVAPQSGFYRSNDNTIVWSRETLGSLRTLPEGSSGNVSFSFETFGLDSGQSFQNPELALEVTIRGRRISERNVPEIVESTIVRTVRTQSDLLLASRAVHSSGPFENSGPLPPVAEQETTYTILWTVTNSHNGISNTQVRATLPSYMRFVGKISPQNADVTFNDIGGEVLWRAGDLEPGGRRELAFQVALSPSISQINTTPTLINEQVLSGTDTFTRTNVGVAQPPLTTRLSTDPNVSSGHDRVVPAGS